MKRKYVLTFPPRVVTKPITYHLVKDYDLVVNILRAQIEEGETGRLVIELSGPKSKIYESLSFLDDQGVSYQLLARDISLDESECVECGACCAVCPTASLSMDTDGTLLFDKDKCILCEVCVRACPVRVITIAL